VALSDIIARIEADAQAEADRIVAEATQRAEQIEAAARAGAERETAKTLAAARATARIDAETIVVKARLAARDAAVARRRELVDRALEATVDAIAGLPDEQYVAWLAARVVDAATGGETLRVGSADTAHEQALRREIERIAPSLQLADSAQPAPFARGALLEGRRVRADLSLETLVADRRDALELVVAVVLTAVEV